MSFLLSGPTGSGKDHFARAFHSASSRSDKPFYVVNCAAIPESLFESQLFGCRKGAYTGSDIDRAGILEAAQGGFVLLNEITDAPLAVQAKLLQAIDEKTIWRVGESSPRKIDVWIAAATNRTDMLKLCDHGLFRRDLYFRLARLVVSIPALCERLADIPELTDHLVRRVSVDLGRRPISFTPEALKALANHDWPGNVRELENLIHSLTLTSEGANVGIELIPKSMRRMGATERRQRITRAALRRMLIGHGWNVTWAAKAIGMSREHVHSLIRRYGLRRPAKNGLQPSVSQLPRHGT